MSRVTTGRDVDLEALPFEASKRTTPDGFEIEAHADSVTDEELVAAVTAAPLAPVPRQPSTPEAPAPARDRTAFRQRLATLREATANADSYVDVKHRLLELIELLDADERAS